MAIGLYEAELSKLESTMESTMGTVLEYASSTLKDDGVGILLDDVLYVETLGKDMSELSLDDIERLDFMSNTLRSLNENLIALYKNRLAKFTEAEQESGINNANDTVGGDELEIKYYPNEPQRYYEYWECAVGGAQVIHDMGG